jgi:predicted SAM-dependent methyltransferase
MIIKKYINYLQVRSSKKVAIGAGEIELDGWLSTNFEFLDLLDRSSFLNYWNEGSRTHFLAEHVWEHLSPSNGLMAAQNCFDFLRHKGRLRIAVPDGLHPDKKYIDYVKPGGSGAGSDDHKVLYDYTTLSKLLTRAGFDIELLEYWDKEGNFHAVPWNVDDGMIRRSIKYDERNKNLKPIYTSLIIDAIKP